MEGFLDKATLETQIKEALGAHGMWKMKLKQATMSGKLPRPAAEIATDDNCTFGKWLSGLKSDPGVAGSPHYAAVVQAHAEFHRQAGRVAALVESGDTARADAELEGAAYRQSTQELGRLMGVWRNNA